MNQRLKNRVIVNSIIKWLSWAILGLIILLLAISVVLHLPPVQSVITTKASKYLSKTTGGEITIDGIHFSTWNGITIENLKVDDPGGNEILVSQLIRLTPNLASIIMGHPDIQYLELRGFRGMLVRNGSELNIQFIINAFSPKQDQAAGDTKSFSMGISQVLFDDIQFEYLSNPDSIHLDLDLDRLEIEKFNLSTLPNKIASESISLQQAELNILSSGEKARTDTTFNLPPLDFGAGFEIAVNLLELKDNRLSYHSGVTVKTVKFDPNHLDLDSIQLRLRDIVAGEDLFSVELELLTAKIGDLSLDHLSTNIEIGMDQADIADLKLVTASSNLLLDLSAKYDSWPNLTEDIAAIRIEVKARGDIQHQDFRYFLKDSIQNFIEKIPAVDLALDGQYSHGNTVIDQFKLVAGKSQLQAGGKLNYQNNQETLAWDQVQLNTTIGPEFRSLITPWTGNLQLPSDIQIRMLTSGLPSQFDVQSSLTSTRGNLDLEASGGITDQEIALSNGNTTGQAVDLGFLLGMSWLGSTDFSMGLEGHFGKDSDFVVNGKVDQVFINGNPIRDIDIQGHYTGETADLRMDITDKLYRSSLHSQMVLRPRFSATTELELADFNMGRLLQRDSTMHISASLVSNLATAPINARLHAMDISIANDSLDYQIDSLAFSALISADTSEIYIHSDDLQGELKANYDLQAAPGLIMAILKSPGMGHVVPGSQDKIIKINLKLAAGKLWNLLSDEVTYASGINLSGYFDGYSQDLELAAHAGRFKGYGVALDTLIAGIHFSQQVIGADLGISNIFYDSLNLGDLKFQVFNQDHDSASVYSRFALQQDTVTLLGFTSRINPGGDSTTFYVDSLVFFNSPLTVDPENKVILHPGNILFDHFTVRGNESIMRLNGDLDNFELYIDQLNLAKLNPLITPNSSLINHGNLNAVVAFSKPDKHINLKTTIDSLIIKNSPAMDISATAVTEDQRIPFEIIFNSTTNNITAKGAYNNAEDRIDALANIDIEELEMFDFLFADQVENISGRAEGRIDIKGSPNAPRFNGSMKLQDINLTTLTPKSSFTIKDEVLILNDSGLDLNDFVIYDQWQNPLRLNGTLLTEDYKSFEYDFTVDTDNYLLINNPEDEKYQVQGILVIGSNLKVKGNERDTRVDAKITIKDTTNLTYIMPQEDLELLSNEGIVEFVDPERADSLVLTSSQSFYDSLIATFPEFNLTSQVILQDKATFRVIVDAKSGDYIEASGAADLKLEIDKSGNTILEGNYSITRGFYQLSFYDLVKKTFQIVPGSSVRWTGDPNNGQLSFKAIHRINSSSIGLIGHEIGENERELYRRSLPYEVGIVIGGTLNTPVISFDLDLPQDDKLSYPVLANKLERLRQPEFESELNKQVFGLLVLGGFIPEASTSEFDQSLSTTALSNSVNSILASQLNRLAGQLVKGVDINVALQSYSDYSGGSGGSQTRTAMDFTLTKRMMDDRLSIEVGGGIDINSDQSGANTGGDNFRGDITVIYNLTESGDKQLKLFNNETYDIIYHEIRNTGISLIFIRDFDKGERRSKQ